MTWWPWCNHHDSLSPLFAAAPKCGDQPNPIHNTNYCKVNEQGQVLTADQIFAQQEGDPVHSGGGGCIQRPIRDVWGSMLNDAVMQPDDVDEYSSKPRPDLIPSGPTHIVFVFDIYNVHHVPLVNPSWTLRWYHAIPHGNFKTPNQVAVNFQKIDGTGYIRLMTGGYVLDRVTDSVTSFVMDQHVDASTYDPERARRDVVRAFERARTGAPVPLPE